MDFIVLLILDGLGIGKRTQANPFTQVQTPTFDWLKANFPYLPLQASGIAVGLPWGDSGSSEVGHLAIGSGRVVYQNYPRITMAIRDGSFFTLPALARALSHLKENNSKLHLVGLVSKAKTHASLEHLEALLRFCKNNKIDRVLLHLIVDGKETLPREAKVLIPEVEKMISQIGVGRVASVCGRYYAMDTNEDWQRTQKYFELLTFKGKMQADWQSALQAAYARNLSDEFVEPTLIGLESEKNNLIISDNDAVIFWNFREEGLRQLVLSLSNKLGLDSATESLDGGFSFFERQTLPRNLFLVTMTQYDLNAAAQALFPPPIIENTLSEVLSKTGKRQLKLAESLKGQLVGYYFNGLRSEVFDNEYQIIIPSEKIINLAKDYRLMTEAIVDRFLAALEERVYNLIVINLANLDAAGHYGDMAIGQKVIQYIDSVVNKICRAVLKAKTPLIITSDHGNIEQMFDASSGKPHTRHTDNPVPFFLVDSRFYKSKSLFEIEKQEREIQGSLTDIAGTILHMFSISPPKEMRSANLLKLIKNMA